MRKEVVKWLKVSCSVTVEEVAEREEWEVDSRSEFDDSCGGDCDVF